MNRIEISYGDLEHAISGIDRILGRDVPGMERELGGAAREAANLTFASVTTIPAAQGEVATNEAELTGLKMRIQSLISATEQWDSTSALRLEGLTLGLNVQFDTYGNPKVYDWSAMVARLGAREIDRIFATLHNPDGTYNWEAIKEILSRSAREISELEYIALVRLLLEMPIESLEVLVNSHLNLQFTRARSEMPHQGIGMVRWGVDIEIFRVLQHHANQTLWGGGSVAQFERLFFLGSIMEMEFRVQNMVRRFESDPILNLRVLEDGSIAVGQIRGSGIVHDTRIVGRQRISWLLQNLSLSEIAQIGNFRSGSTNITTNATRFAFAFGFAELNGFFPGGEDDDRSWVGTDVNAMRHMFWMGFIAAEFDGDIARGLGNAHEADPHILQRIVDPFRHQFHCIDTADLVADLLNNEIGISIGTSTENLTMSEVARLTLTHAYEQGFHVVGQRDGRFVVEVRQLTSEEYTQAVDTFHTLDANGFPPDHPRRYDQGTSY
ncbi:MAG: hypothetical protein FWC72_06040 [Oscillospiraceae bacterium]|nr:hypothetical protein [Oscillospiraceae bacterium]